MELARYPLIMISCPPALMVRVGSFLQDSIVWVNFWYVCHYCLHFPPEHVNNAQPRNPSPYTICRPLAIVVSGPSYLGRCSGCLLPNTHFSTSFTSSYIHICIDLKSVQLLLWSICSFRMSAICVTHTLLPAHTYMHRLLGCLLHICVTQTLLPASSYAHYICTD